VKRTAEHGRSDRESATGRLLGAYKTRADTRARDRLVQLYLPLVEALAHRHDRRGAEHDDLVQAGSIGLLNAIERFDPSRGGEFAAFAVPTIAGEMKRHLRDRTAAVRLPRRLHEASTRLPAAREELTARLGREPSAAELGDALGISGEDLAQIESAAATPVDEAVVDSGDDALEVSDDRMLLAGAFHTLDETDRRIVYLRYVKELSRRQTAQEVGISEAALARRTETALARLRNELEGRAFEGPGQDTPARTAKTTVTPKQREARHSGRLLLRMPQSLHAELAEAAEREEVSLNQYITNTLAAGVGWHTSDHPEDERQAQAPPPWLPAALVTNIVVVVIAGAVALILLVVALRQGL
jgi:RNA polymerase sigma-B factor